MYSLNLILTDWDRLLSLFGLKLILMLMSWIIIDFNCTYLRVRLGMTMLYTNAKFDDLEISVENVSYFLYDIGKFVIDDAE